MTDEVEGVPDDTRAALVRFCGGYLGPGAEAEDAAAEAIARALEARPDEPRPWTFRAARNLCLNALRDRRVRRADPLPSDLAAVRSVTGPLTRLAREEERAHVRGLVERLSAAQREVLRLRYADGLTRAEIAEVVGEPESVVKSRLFEAVQRLRALGPGQPG